MDQDLKTALVGLAGELRRPVLPILRYSLRTVPGAKAAPTNWVGGHAAPRCDARRGMAMAGTR
jgi:hypothetical protein